MSYRFEIGSITSGYRTIRDGSKYDKYFTKPDAQDRIIIEDGEVEDTVDLMKRVVWKYIDDTQSIATVLQGNTTKESCSNIWNFLYHHIQYKLDQRGLEQLRRPARSWADRETGIDCDCFSIFASSILTNLKIPHSFRITKYGGSHFQHVYVVIPHGSKTIVVDPVLSTFDYEKPFTEHKDFPISDEQKNNIMHVSLPISKHSCLMGADDIQNQQNTGSNITISINLEDDKEADRLFTELSEKGKIVMPLERKFWGDYYGMLVDQFGISWMLNSSTQS